MAKKTNQPLRDEDLQAAMAQLIPNGNFGTYIKAIRDQREVVIKELCSDAVMKDDRLTCAAVGELRSYENLISMYDDFVDRRDAESNEE
jgi:hypothetical protein